VNYLRESPDYFADCVHFAIALDHYGVLREGIMITLLLFLSLFLVGK
jgi:hypothetical protein